MKTFKFIIPLMLLFAAMACSRDDQELCLQPDSKGGDYHSHYQNIKIIVLSDIHYMEPSLLKADGTAFQTYLMQDPKLLAESGAILQQLILRIMIEKPDLVLISGDLTKDGELVSHKALIAHLRMLGLGHIRVYVIPGNHDINNPDAKQFNGDVAIPVPSITAEKFAALYADFGYNSAISRDPNSLSYVVEPFKGVRILALDANEYYNNTSTYSTVAGKIKDATMDWALAQLNDAKSKGKTVIGMMHHGVIEHFMGESMLFSDYLIDNWSVKADILMQAGLKVIFTGHFHANDAVQRTTGNYSLTDVETGSPVIYHSSYRIVKLSDSKLYIDTKHIDHIFYPGLKGIPFTDYEKAFSLKGFELQARYMLMSPPYNVPQEYALQISPVFAAAMLAHFEGDETITPEVLANIKMVSDFSADLGNMVAGLYSDLPPADNQLIVDLN